MHILVVLFGFCIGSFLNVIILRLEQGRKPDGRSKCPHCGHTLRWFELVPVLSWVVQGGRCRVCKCKLSAQYPLVELVTGVTFLAVYVHTVPLAPALLDWLVFLVHAALWATLIVIAVYDLRTTYIPDRFNLIFALLAFATVVLSVLSTSYSARISPDLWVTGGLQATSSVVLEHLLAALLLFLPFYLLWKLSSGRWMGLGDGKLATGIGLLLGLEAGFSAIMFAFWIGAIVMLTILATQRIMSSKKTLKVISPAADDALSLKSEIPFGPFLVIGTAVVYFTGLTYTSLLTPLFL